MENLNPLSFLDMNVSILALQILHTGKILLI